MKYYKTVYEILQDHLPSQILSKIVEENDTDEYRKKFTALRHLNTMMYAHLTEKKGLEDIEIGIKSDMKLQEHTGTISDSQLSRVNSQRDPEVFKAVFDAMVRELGKHDGIRLIPGQYGILKVLDSTLVRLCTSLFPWANYRSTTAGVKIHTLYNLLLDAPEMIVLTEGALHDKKMMPEIITESGVTYIFDRAYLDHNLWDNYCENEIFFVSRLKDNAIFEVVGENFVADGSNVLSDKIVILGCNSKKMRFPVRLAEVIDSSNGEVFYIVTNRFDLTADEIADIYRLRWSIECFFKWIKQHLKIKKFYGTSFNAILNQIYSAMILYCLLKLFHILYCKKSDFLSMVRAIAYAPWYTLAELMLVLIPAKKQKRSKHKRFNWKEEYKDIIKEYNLIDLYL